MKSEFTIKQLLRKKYFGIKKDLLLNNKGKTNNYHWGLRQNVERLVGGLIENKEIVIKNHQLLVGTYLPILQRQIIPPSFSPKFQQKYGIKARYFTPYFTSKDRKMQFVNYDIKEKKSEQFCLGPFGVKTPKIQQQGHIINPSNLHVLLVPLISIERNSLHRIGYGGGYYDEYIKQSKTKMTVSIGVALQDLVFDQNQLKQNQKKQKLWNQWDQPLEYGITQKTIIKRKYVFDQIPKNDIFHDSLQLQLY